MSQNTKMDEWVWIIIQNPGGNEQILGQLEPEKQLSFIPAFKTREEAQNGFLQLPRETGLTYEVQAIILEDLIAYVGENGFLLYILDAAGKIIETIDPSDNDHASK